jgi:hypothetical protein
MTQHFETHNWTTGKIADCDPQFPTDMHGVEFAPLEVEDPAGAWFGYVQEGEGWLATGGCAYKLRPGDYFSTAQPFRIGDVRAILIRRHGADVPFMLGNDRAQLAGRHPGTVGTARAEGDHGQYSAVHRRARQQVPRPDPG